MARQELKRRQQQQQRQEEQQQQRPGRRRRSRSPRGRQAVSQQCKAAADGQTEQAGQTEEEAGI